MLGVGAHNRMTGREVRIIKLSSYAVKVEESSGTKRQMCEGGKRIEAGMRRTQSLGRKLQNKFVSENS